MTAELLRSHFISAEELAQNQPPAVDGLQYVLNGELKPWDGKKVDVTSPCVDASTGKPIKLGEVPMFAAEHALAALASCDAAWDNGMGAWPTASPSVRIAALEKFNRGLAERAKLISQLLTLEICKPIADSVKEVSRTVEYISATIDEYKKMENSSSTFSQAEGILSQVRRAPYGITVVMGPFNYPFNETYCTLIPALLTGNTVLLKVPRVGCLCHTPTLELFRDCFPPGVINTVYGSGRETMPPIMKTGKCSVLGFIGTSKAADALQRDHPNPHRLRACLGLEAKNPAIVLPDADLDVAIAECLLGSLSFNGQRCTALKILLVHKSVVDEFVARFVKAVDALPMGPPWRPATKITPLPEAGKPEFLKELIKNAQSLGASIANERARACFETPDAIGTLFPPTVLYPVTAEMKIYHEEQFGPVVPIATFERPEEVFSYLAQSQYGQQASLFGRDSAMTGRMIDVLVNQVSRVNLNSTCQRGPDSLPFTGRKDSAFGTLSVYDALRVFTIRSLVAAKATPDNKDLVNKVLASQSSNFLRLDYLF